MISKLLFEYDFVAPKMQSLERNPLYADRYPTPNCSRSSAGSVVGLWHAYWTQT